MHPALQAIKMRRSIRAYTNQPVAHEILEDLVDCGRLAPTAMNVQPWEFVILTEAATLAQLPKLMGYADFLATAPACIVVLSRPTEYFLEDCCAATENILLAAEAYGLGSCWIAGARMPFEDALLALVHAPAGYKLVALLPVGHPAEAPQIEKRALTDVLHWEKL